MSLLLKVLILDDERAMHTIMKQMLARIDDVEVVGCFLHSESAMEFVRKETVDLAFIDIQIGIENGLQAAKELRSICEKIDIVFVTSHKDYALEAFAAYPLDYIVKPVSRSRLEQTLARAAERRKQYIRDEDKQKSGLCARLLGSFELLGPSGEHIRWMSRKSAELFAYLLVHRGRFIAKARIIEDVFPEMPVKNAETYLNTAVYQLRKALTSVDMKSIVETSNEQYRLITTAIEVDFIQFEEKLKLWYDQSPIDLDEGMALEQLYAGELLENNDYPWCKHEAYRLEQLYLNLAKSLAGKLLADERLESALILLKRILLITELDEEANVMLLKTYHELKDWLSLKTHLQQYEELYTEELGLPLPSEIRDWAQ